MKIDDLAISRAILADYTSRFGEALDSDVLIAGGGPSGLVAATTLARQKLRVVLLEKRLAPGGGIWGGGMLMNTIVTQAEAERLLVEFGVRYEVNKAGLLVVQSVELGSALILKAVQAGVTILNGITVEDVCVSDERVTGLVANFTPVDVTGMHVDPLTFRARAVLDGTGHDAVLAALLMKHNFQLRTPSGRVEGEGAMWADKGEEAVLTYTREVFPGAYVSGMAACAVFGGPRMGPIFGGMLLSGEKAAELISKALAEE